jgi:hypothetical protein
MHRPLLAALCGIMLLSGCAARTTEDMTLETLRSASTGAASACVLKPLEHAQGAVFFPVDSNPFVSRDPDTIRFVSMWLLFPRTGAAAEETYDEQSLHREAELIEAAYVAIYESLPGGPETGVYGLQFRDAIPAELSERLEANTAIVEGKLAVLVWTDSADQSCYEAVRSHVESALGR